MKFLSLLFILTLTTLSCSRKINLEGFYDPNQSFEVYQHEVGTTEFRLNEKRHTQLISWLALNSENWKPTRNDWCSLVVIKQNKFTLLLFRNGDFSVVGIPDDNNQIQFYSKESNNDGFHILEK